MFALDPVSLLVSIIAILFLLNFFYDRKGNIYKNFPPGPKPLPIIGNLHLLLTQRQEPHRVFHELSKKYGSVFSIQIGPKKMVVLCGYEAVKDALVNHADEFSERPAVPVIEKMANGHGIVFAHGENWKVMRRFALTALRDYGMGKKVIEDKISEESDLLVEVFKSYNGKPFDNVVMINAAVANIIVTILLGHRFEYNNPRLLKIMKLINENVKIFNSPMVLLYNAYPSVMSWIPGTHKTIVKNTKEMEIFYEDTFKKQKAQLDINDQRNLIDAFLVKQQEVVYYFTLQEKPNPGLYFNNDNLVYLVADLFGAGMETTSTTLRWGLLLMMKHPEIQKNVQNEIDRVIGSANPQTEHRKEMPYTDAVIHEIQRFGNIAASGLPRATTRDVTFRGYFLPRGTEVLPVLGTVLQDASYFEKPEDFYPQHFLDSKGNFVKNEAFLPFAAGRRACAGENLAKMELFLFFTRLIQKFTFRPPPGVEVDLTPFSTGTRSPIMNVICALPRD
ncbi:cytochrome P450 2K1-like isoform 1-T1 [Pelodytes ibericus]